VAAPAAACISLGQCPEVTVVSARCAVLCCAVSRVVPAATTVSLWQAGCGGLTTKTPWTRECVCLCACAWGRKDQTPSQCAAPLPVCWIAEGVCDFKATSDGQSYRQAHALAVGRCLPCSSLIHC
jgi:hypothetical protein